MPDLSTTIRDIFPKKKIVILGDLVADQFLRGTISRVSREAPVFILRHDETETLAGGAANAAVNIAALGGKPMLVGLMGNDVNGKLLSDRLSTAGVRREFLVSSDAAATTTKVRVLAGQHYAPRQQVIRIDYENGTEIDVNIVERLQESLQRASAGADAIVISDYGYGVADSLLIEDARRLSAENGIPLLIDSRFKLRDFAGATTAAPNQEEIEAILGKDFTDADCEKLRAELAFEALLVTCGNKGMLLVENGKAPLHMPAVGGLEPMDVTGAGDTVIAVYALGVASGLSFADAAQVANHAGGIVVMKKGTASVSTEELLPLDQIGGWPEGVGGVDLKVPDLTAPILDRGSLKTFVADQRASGSKIILANGCFDLIHAGHIRYLQGAKQLGGTLIVAINSDDQVRSLKGNDRPFVSESERAEIVAAIRAVDAVTIFRDPTVTELILAIKPDIHAKGTDYTVDTVPEREIVRSYGGSVAIVGDPKDHSSTDLIKIIALGDNA